jgi:hypothetical protein
MKQEKALREGADLRVTVWFQTGNEEIDGLRKVLEIFHLKIEMFLLKLNKEEWRVRCRHFISKRGNVVLSLIPLFLWFDKQLWSDGRCFIFSANWGGWFKGIKRKQYVWTELEEFTESLTIVGCGNGHPIFPASEGSSCNADFLSNILLRELSLCSRLP